MILLFAALFIADLFSIAFPFIAYYLWREWDTYNGTTADAYADRCLYGAITLLAFMLLGRFLIKALLSKHRKGEDEPRMFALSKNDIIKRPDGTQINIEQCGNEKGQPIIFIHGLNANSKNWYYQRTYFEKDYRLIMMDLPGLGKSTRPLNKDFSLSKIARDLNAVIEYTNAKNPILWGHSMGGMTILTLLAKHRASMQQPIKGVILEHTTYTNPVKTTLFHKVLTLLQKPLLVPLCWLLIILSPLIWIIRWMSYLNGGSLIISRWLMFTGTQTPKQLDFVTLLSTLAPPAVTGRSVLAMFKYDVTHDLKSIDIPTLIIAAEKDRLTKPEASRFMDVHLPNSKMVTLSSAGHQGLVERHAEVNKSAKKFILEL